MSGYFFVVASLEQFSLKGEMSRSDKGVLRSNEKKLVNSQRTFWSLTLHPSALSGTFPFREGCLSLACFKFKKISTNSQFIQQNLIVFVGHGAFQRAEDSPKNNGQMISAPTASNETHTVGRWLAAAVKYI
ncbi:MAG: hypothetical protein IJC13_05075 [Clostridia bacterium]|nr:hypothetical protein [Clostridia bacterium]